ncbi:MAG: rRNA maturation RNase YbeY [Leptolyngbya sp. PLA1]|nr:rRNA maturation RNase YbeY [Leptolyngbya sp. PLA1]
MSPEFTLYDQTGKVPAPARRWIAECARKCFDIMNLVGSIRVCVLDDAAMGDLHRRSLGIPETTDVLTFDLLEPSEKRPRDPTCLQFGSEPLGIDTDIYVCLDEAARHSDLGGYPVERELLLYVLHGVLHCLGYDDHSDEGWEAMHRKEDEILTAIGVGPVFRNPDQV